MPRLLHKGMICWSNSSVGPQQQLGIYKRTEARKFVQHETDHCNQTRLKQFGLEGLGKKFKQ